MGGRPPRLAPDNYAGQICCFLTFCTRDRNQVFRDPALCASVLDQFRIAASSQCVSILAYCLMPDHIHLLGRGSPASDLARWGRRCKQRSGFTAVAFGISPLWQRGFFDRVLRDEDDAIDVAAYILANPIRAGLAKVIGEYAWAGSDVFTTCELADAIQMRPGWW